jgi:hypothetical protein
MERDLFSVFVFVAIIMRARAIGFLNFTEAEELQREHFNLGVKNTLTGGGGGHGRESQKYTQLFSAEWAPDPGDYDKKPLP